MKKYKKLTKELTFDNHLIEFLEKEAQKGWKLKSMNHFILTFQKEEPQQLKYQIDYNELTSEYMSVLQDLGYQLVCSYENKHVYNNSNTNADDLQTDYQSQILAMQPYYHLKSIAYSLFWTCAFLFWTYRNIDNINHIGYPHSLALFFTETYLYISIVIFACWFINSFLEMFYLIIMNKHLKKQYENGTYQTNPIVNTFTKIHKYINIMSNILVLLSIFMLISYFLSIPLIISLIVFLECIILIIIHYTCVNFQYHKFIQYITVLFFIIITILIYQSKMFSIPSIHQPLYSENLVKDTFLNESKGLFANTKSIDIYSEHYEKYVECLNHHVAEVIFQQDIIIADRELRKEKILTEYQAIGKKYDESDYPYISFENSLKNMTRFQTELVDQCYYNPMYVVCIKDNKVLSFSFQGDIQLIENILEYDFS